MKCLTCHSGGRGKSQPKAGGALRGDHGRPGQGSEEYLHCGCPLSTALLELWITKMAVQNDPNLPSRPLGSKALNGEGDLNLKKADFSMSPAVLMLVAASIHELCGLSPLGDPTGKKTLFADSETRLTATILDNISALRINSVPRAGRSLLSDAQTAIEKYATFMCCGL